MPEVFHYAETVPYRLPTASIEVVNVICHDRENGPPTAHNGEEQKVHRPIDHRRFRSLTHRRPLSLNIYFAF